MKFLIQHKGGKPAGIYEADGVDTPDGILARVHGDKASDFVAVPYDESVEGNWPEGKRIDETTKTLIADPDRGPSWEDRAKSAEAQIKAIKDEVKARGIILDALK